MKWKPISAHGAMLTSGGMISSLSIALIDQYNRLISTSSGALHNDRLFLMKKRVGDSVISASKPKMKVAYATVSPNMVKY